MNLETVLDVLGLTDYYPGKITQDLLYQITELDFTNVENKPEKIAWQFIRKIVHRDYNARVVRYDKIVEKSSAGFREKLEQQRGKLVEQIHPLDIVVAVFICCDPIARQDIVTHLWECRLAIPFILPPSCDHDNTLSAYIWPLRSLEGLFRQENGEFIEKSIVDQPFNCIGFMKIGEIAEWSKSNFLNCLIWGSEKTHPSFYHRNCKGSKKRKSDIVDGLVEICWYLPCEEEVDDTENFANPTLLLNLRGDATRHKEQTLVVNAEMDLQKLLTEIGLLQFYPGKMKTQDLFSISFYNFDYTSRTNDPKQLCEKYQCEISSFLSDCRFFKTLKLPRQRNLLKTVILRKHVHPLDISTLLFICCDDIGRQDLVRHLWACEHAFPFVVEVQHINSRLGHTRQVNMFAWSMRGIVGQIGDKTCSLSQMEFRTVSCFRVSQSEHSSKSFIFNSIINKTVNGSSIFYHRDCIGSVKERSEVVCGMIEAFPYMNTGQGSLPTLYLNLRGNALDLKKQLSFISQISHVLVIFCRFSECHDALQCVKKACLIEEKCVFIIIRDECIDDVSTNGISEAWPGITFLSKQDMQVQEIAENVSQTIDCLKQSVSLDKVVEIALNNVIHIDEKGHDISKTIEMSQYVSNMVLKRYESGSSNYLFPVQGEHYLQWAEADKEIYKLRKYTMNKDMKIQEYRENLQSIKLRSRKQQFEMLSNFKSGKCFIMDLINSEKAFDSVSPVYVRCLKLSLDDMCRTNICRLFSKYKSLFYEMKLQGKDPLDYENKLKELDTELNLASLSVSIILRELGQIYESMMSQGTPDTNHLWHLCKNLPKVAVFLLLEGYAIEIMDGRSFSVPFIWIEAVLLELKNHLGNVKIKVVSVLGMQSTGKSTLLNTMFSCQFPTGLGRCTRGVQISLVKVSKGVTEPLLVRYFLVVDTEGILVASMQATLKNQTESELATFALGVANTTLINVSGEDVSYLQDILPISVLAFVRMDQVGIKPKCKLIRHNVDRKHKTDLSHQSNILQQRLDDFTEDICRMECLGKKTFKDIINFDLDQDVHYFSPPFESKKDETDCQETISRLYSRDAIQLRNDLVKDQNCSFSISEFSGHLTSLWKAIKKEDFVYEFSSITEADARAKLDLKLCSFNRTKRQELEDIISNYRKQMANLSKIEHFDSIAVKYNSDLDDILKTAGEGLSDVFVQLQRECQSNVIKHLKRIKDACMQEFIKCLKESIDEGKDLLDNEKTIRWKELKFIIDSDKETIEMKKEIDKYIAWYLPTEKNPHRLFEKWSETVNLKERVVYTQDLDDDKESSLYTCFLIHRKTVKDVLCESNKAPEKYSLETFEIAKEFWSTDWEHDLRREKELAKTIHSDTLNHCKFLVRNIKKRKIWYSKRLFIDLGYRIRSWRINTDSFHVKQKFEIKLTLSALNYLINELIVISSQEGLISDSLKIHIRSYFMYRYKATIGDISNADYLADQFAEEIFRAVSDNALESTTNLILPGLAHYFKNAIMNDFPFLKSKQSLIGHIWGTMLEKQFTDELDHIRYYLTNPYASVKSWLSELCRTNITEIDDTTLKQKLRKYAEEQITEVCTLIRLDAIDMSTSTDVMKTCIDFIISKLDKVLVIYTLRIYENYKIETDVPIDFMTMLLDKLKKQLDRLVIRLHLTLTEHRSDEIIIQTSESIFNDVIGCDETCPSCGELCCVGQKNHTDLHRALMHRPRGMKGAFFKPSETTYIDTSACINCSSWSIPSDVSAAENSFWKYMFVKYVHHLRPSTFHHVPESWKALSKRHVKHDIESIIGDKTNTKRKEID